MTDNNQRLNEQALLELAFARARALGTSGMELAAHLCQLGTTTIKGVDYVRRDSIMNEVMGWRKAFDSAPEVPADAIRAAIEQAAPEAPAAASVKPRDIFAICDAYESGIGHGLRQDGHRSGAMFGNHEHGKAYEIGYAEGEDRAQQSTKEKP